MYVHVCSKVLRFVKGIVHIHISQTVVMFVCVCICLFVQESDLHSAVCLEQAAHSFLRIHPSMSRKYALHLILAGHRFAKSGQVNNIPSHV